MSMRVGIDMICVNEVRDSLADHGERYLSRVFSAREVSDCTSGARLSPSRLAGRFAAKEAAFKALGVSDEAVPWTDIEVLRDPSGAVSLELTDTAATLARREGIVDFAVSLSHEREFATAVVIADCRNTTDCR
jgi:holo-[acyl-carrier protein] synthase